MQSGPDIKATDLATDLQSLRMLDIEDSVVVIADPDKDIRTVIRHMLGALLPGVEFVEIDDLTCLSSGIKNRVALLLVALEDENEISRLSLLRTPFYEGGYVHDIYQNKPGTDDPDDDVFDNVPVVAMLNGPDYQASAERLLEWRNIDGLISKPFSKTDLLEIVRTSISRRKGIFDEVENKLRPGVIKEFLEYYGAMIKVWETEIRSMDSFPGDSSKIEPDSTAECINSILQSIIRIARLLDTLKDMGENLSNEDLAQSKFVHDMNNPLIWPLYGLQYIEKRDLTEKDLAVLIKIQEESCGLKGSLDGIHMAYHGKGTWFSVEIAKSGPQAKDHLEFPNGTIFCVVDDDESILKIAGKTIEQAGGKVLTAKDRESFMAIEGDVQVVLLDNNLGDGVFGHELISVIRAKFPNALIIAHTSDAMAINKNSENLYKKAGVEVVGKRDWHAVGGVIRRKLPASFSEVP